MVGESTFLTEPIGSFTPETFFLLVIASILCLMFIRRY